MQLDNKPSRLKYYISIFLIVLLQACQVSKYIPEDQFLVKSNEIEFESDKPIQQKNTLSNELKALVQQEESSNFQASQYFYWHRPRPDTSSVGRYFIRRTKEPSFFSEPVTIATNKSMKNYMIQRGYFKADVDYDFKLDNKRADIFYTVYPGPRFTINKLEYKSQDTVIQNILRENRSNSFLRPGRPVDQRLYESEVNRITSLLQNKGYANFYSNYVEPLQGDSTGNKVNIVLEVSLQSDGKAHTSYTIGNVRVFSDYDPEFPLDRLEEDRFSGLRFLSKEGKYSISKRALSNNIFLKSGDVYSRENYNKSLRRLGRLAAVKFVTIRSEPDPYDSTVLHYNVFITPGPKIGLSVDLDINNSTLSNFNQQFLGFSARLGIRNRNLFGGAESNSFNISGGLEIDPRTSFNDVINFYIRLQDDIQLPKFVDVPGVFKFLDWIKVGDFKLLNKDFYDHVKGDAFTRISASSDFVIQRLFYNYTSLNFNYGFDLAIDNRKRWTINQTGINYFAPTFTADFEENILSQNPFLERSLARQFFTGFVLREVAFNYTSRTNRANETYTLLSNFEVSGLEIATIGLIMGRPIRNFFQDDVEFSKYVRLDIDGRYNKVYNERESAAFRLNIGIAAPYEISEDVPFVKQFFVGGGLSLRAWELREIGPGSYRDFNQQDRGVQDRFQTGDFKFEINGEYRLNLIWKLEGAAFLDIGNVWLLRADPNRPGAQLTARNFLTDLAVGSGLGLRLLFDFFIIRFDMGVKVKNPYKDPITNSYLARGTFGELTNPNLAINYSF